MHSTEIDSYLHRVLIQVHFFPDHDEIKLELRTHIKDSITTYKEQGFSVEEAEKLCLSDLGDAKIVGRELNRVHNPLIGWLYLITQIVMILILSFSVYYCGGLLCMSLIGSLDRNQGIKKDTIVATLDVDQTVTIDDDIYHFYRLIYDTNGDLHLLWTSRNRYLFLDGTYSSFLGVVTDEFGTRYYENGSASGGLIQYHRFNLENFNPESQTLFIDYDNYQREYHLQFDLPENWMKGGSSNESQEKNN